MCCRHLGLEQTPTRMQLLWNAAWPSNISQLHIFLYSCLTDILLPLCLCRSRERSRHTSCTVSSCTVYARRAHAHAYARGCIPLWEAQCVVAPCGSACCSRSKHPTQRSSCRCGVLSCRRWTCAYQVLISISQRYGVSSITLSQSLLWQLRTQSHPFSVSRTSSSRFSLAR